MRRLAPIALVALAAAAVGAARTGAEPSVKVVDRTMVCAAALSGGIHEVEIRVQSGSVRKGSRWDSPPFAIVTTGSTGAAAEALDNALGWVVAGTPTARANLVQTLPGFTYPVTAWGTVAMSNRCKVSRVRPALSSKGLNAAFVGPFGEVFDCTTPRSFLVRTRAVLRKPADLNTRRGYFGTTTPVTEGEITIATPTGTRLAYAEVLASGKARLFTARGCIPD